MKKLGLLAMLLPLVLPLTKLEPLAVPVVRAQPAPSFQAIDVYVETEAPLAAYQIEVRASAAVARVVDIAALTTEPEAPSGRFRVARIHMQEPGGVECEYTATLVTAATPGGETMSIRVKLEKAGGQR